MLKKTLIFFISLLIINSFITIVHSSITENDNITYQFILDEKKVSIKETISFETDFSNTNFNIILPIESKTVELDINTLSLKYESNTFNIYKLDGKRLEIEVEFKEIPSKDIFIYPINTNGLKFYKQLPLNLELSKDEYFFINETHALNEKGETMIYRRKEIVNSYAVYYDSNYNNFMDTGKVFHLERAYLIDSKNDKVFIDFNIIDSQIVYYLDMEFLKNAVYPVKLSPVFGYTTIGETGLNIGVQGVVSMCKFTTPYIDGNSIIHITNITHRTWYGNDGYYSLGMIYSKDEVLNQPSLYLDVSSNTRELLSYNWLVFNMDYNATENQILYLGIYGQANYWSLGDSNDTDRTHLFYQSPSNYPTPFNYADRTGRTTPDYIMSVYATYEIISLEEEEEELILTTNEILTIVFMSGFIMVLFFLIFLLRLKRI